MRRGGVCCQAQTQIENSEDFEKISWEELNDNAIRMIGKDWMLVTAGDPEDYNMMTASWGSLGWLWRKPGSPFENGFRVGTRI
ncbi:MAG: hypothetical protein R6U19_10930 [Bacteroidales bacterium]